MIRCSQSPRQSETPRRRSACQRAAQPYRQKEQEDRGPLTRSIAELEAESVAYVVCKHFGLDAEVRASRYIALWDGDSKALRTSLERIADAAREIIDDVEAVRSRKAVA